MNKTIPIIGAAPGPGMAVAKKFGSEGFETILVARNEEALRSTLDLQWQTENEIEMVNLQ